MQRWSTPHPPPAPVLPCQGPKGEDRPLKRQVLSINSRDRKNPTATTPQDYTVVFPAITNVHRIGLLTTEFTNSRYLIDNTNNSIDFVSSGGPAGTFTAVLASGHYNITDLVTEVNDKLDAALGVAPGTIFNVTYDPTTALLTIQRIDGHSFSLLFGSGTNSRKSPVEVLGFASVDTPVATSHTGSKAANAQGDDYALLCLDGFGRMVGTEVQSDAFAKLIWPVPARYQSFSTFASADCEMSDWPRARLESLHVRVLRPNGHPYDFQGVEHSFTLELWTQS
jgi:hypothetical protein